MKKVIKVLLICIFIFNFIYINISAKNIKNINISEDIQFYNITLNEALGILSKELNISIICDSSSKDEILNHYFIKEESLFNILKAICFSQGLNYKELNGIIFLSKKSDSSTNFLVGKVVESEFKGALSGVAVDVKDSNLDTSFTSSDGKFILNSLDKGIYLARFSKKGYKTLSKIISIDKDTNIENIVLEKSNSSGSNYISLDIEKATVIDNKTFYTKEFDIKNTKTSEIKQALNEMFGEKLKVTEIEKNNILMLLGEKDTLFLASEIIESLDKRVKQVKITSQILSVTDNLFEELGFDWFYNDGNNHNNNLSISVLGNLASSQLGSVYGSKVNFFKEYHSKKDILGLGINLLQSNQDLVVSSVPTILVSSGEEGVLKITEEVIVGERKYKVKDENSEKNYVSEPIFKEAGIIFKVEPLVKDNGEVVLKVNIEVSDFKFKNNLMGKNESGTYNAQGGSKIGSDISTTIKLKDNETVLIGGLKKAITHNLESKVPILGDIPVIKFLFRNTSTRKEYNDMYIKLSVNILEN